MTVVLAYLLSPIYYFFLGFFLLLFHPIQWVCYHFFGYKAHKRSVDWLNFLLCYSNLLVFSVPRFKSPFRLPSGRPIIFVSNHQSFKDIPGLIFFLRKYHAKFVSKIELLHKHIPSISFNLKYGGGANIDRKDGEQSKNELLQFANRMKMNNWSVFIFPEGSRSKDHKVKTFKVGGLALLVENVPNVLIVPVAIKEVRTLVKKGSLPLFWPFGEICWEILAPIEPNKNDISLSVREAEEAIRWIVEK